MSTGISRRTFLRTAAATTAGLAGLPLARGAEPTDWTVVKCRAVENPTGIQFGFWNNYYREAEALRVFGRRPIAREGFTQWRFLEKQQGAYDWGKHFGQFEMLHRCGTTAVVALNVIFSREVNPKVATGIPPFYPPRISDPKTREAARKFVYAYVQEILRRIGRVILCFDYELHWFYLPKTDAVRREYRDWFVEACALARRAAADLGKADLLKLIPISNGNPITAAEKFLGGDPGPKHTPQQWMLDVAGAGDYFGLDTYAFDPAAPASPETTLHIVQFWKDYYAGGKPIYITENGFSTVMQANPKFPRSGHHARGTEAEQRDYFAAVLDGLVRENRPGGLLDNQVRAYCIWMFHDMKGDGKENALEHFFGVVRDDGSLKPAGEVIRDRFRRYEADPTTCPHRIVSREDVTVRCSGRGEPVPVTYSAGTEFDFLHCERGCLPQGARHVLRVETAAKGDLIVCVNGTEWLTTAGQDQTAYALDVTPHVQPAVTNTCDVWFTSAVFPFQQSVSKCAWHTSGA
jgi:hypothetical protein